MKTQEIQLLKRVVSYSDRYQISIQFWPDQCAVYIMKDDVDLNSFGSSQIETTLKMALDYLDRINRKP